MSNIWNLSYRDILVILNKLDYKIIRQKGSHILLKNQNRELLVLPTHKQLKIGTVMQIVKSTKLSKDDFLSLLDE